VALFIIWLFLAARRGSRIDVALIGSDLVVRLRGVDVLWTFRRRVTVSVDLVRGVAVSSLAAVPTHGLRLPGIAIPGVIRAGSYGTGNDRSFWDVRRGPEILWVELVDGAPYRRLILEVPDPHELALRLRPHLGAWVPQEWQA
jgi:hypothetical protein